MLTKPCPNTSRWYVWENVEELCSDPDRAALWAKDCLRDGLLDELPNLTRVEQREFTEAMLTDDHAEAGRIVWAAMVREASLLDEHLMNIHHRHKALVREA